MKKMILSFIAFLLFVSMSNIQIKAVEENEQNNSIMITEELEMPSINSGNSREANARQLWLASVVNYNENHYEQEVVHVEECDDKYILYFEPKEILQQDDILDNLNGPEEIDESKWGVSKIEYIKPEALGDYADDLLSRATTYTYKFTYYYSWSNGFYRFSKKTFSDYASIGANAILSFVPTKNVLVSFVINQAISSQISKIDKSKAITAESYNSYYYENKVCSVKASTSTTWIPSCQIGRRLAFGWSWSTAFLKSTGQPKEFHETASKTANGIPPTNYDGDPEKKPHFSDNTWMKNKAKETMHTGGYVDVYAVCDKVRP